ncbi:hypothetical protein BT69DRAFT_1300570 [Atractiella rhizophila]|nr:hypothetical protein BT69DRAFT_1300570 [Atractiella rhizophila]
MTQLENGNFRKWKRCWDLDNFAKSVTENQILRCQHKTVVDVAEKEDCFMEFSLCFFHGGALPAMGFGIRHNQLWHGCLLDLEQLSFTDQIDLIYDEDDGVVIRDWMRFPQTSKTSFELQLEFLQSWSIDPFLQLPTELVDRCLTEMLDDERRTIKFRRIQHFRLVCKRFNAVGITKICQLTGQMGYYDLQHHLNVIPMVKTWGTRIVPWIRQLNLFRFSMETEDPKATWNTVLSILSETLNLLSLYIQLQTPSSDWSRKGFFEQIGALRHLQVLTIISWDATDAWGTHDLCLLLKQPLTSLMNLLLSGWDLVPLPHSALQPLPRAKLTCFSINSSFMSREIISQMLPFMLSVAAWEPEFFDGPNGLEAIRPEPLPLNILDLRDNWIAELRSQDILDLLQNHGRWLNNFKFSLRPLQQSKSIFFTIPLKGNFNSSVFLHELYLDGLHEFSGILEPDFLQTFHCPFVTELSISHCHIPITEVHKFLQRRRTRGIPSEYFLRIALRTFYNDEVAQSVNEMTLRDMFSNLQATIEGGTGQVPTKDDFSVVSHDFHFTFKEGGA